MCTTYVCMLCIQDKNENRRDAPIRRYACGNKTPLKSHNKVFFFTSRSHRTRVTIQRPRDPTLIPRWARGVWAKNWNCPALARVFWAAGSFVPKFLLQGAEERRGLMVPGDPSSGATRRSGFAPRGRLRITPSNQRVIETHRAGTPSSPITYGLVLALRGGRAQRARPGC